MKIQFTTFKALRCIFFVFLLHVGSLSHARAPNIIFILADDYGYNDIGYHGSPIKTPVLDKLAESGVKLENYYVQPVCTPSRSQLLSGRYQIYTGLQHLVISNEQPSGLPVQFVTLADQLRHAGYATHMVGKWHLGFYNKAHLPVNRGFDTFFGYYGGGEHYYTHESCSVNRLRSSDCGLDLHNGTDPVRSQNGVYSTHMFAQEAERIIRSQKDSHQPMFLYLALQSVHSPMEVPDHYTEPYRHLPGVNRVKYAGMVAAMDEAIGNVTQALAETKMADNTVLIFSTDNGGLVSSGGNNWPLRGGKMTLWEGGVRAIGFVTSPLLAQRGVTSQELIHITDWYPTLVNLAGGSMQGVALDGYDVWDTIAHGKPSPRKELLHNIDPLFRKRGTDRYGNATFPTSMRAAIRVGDMKLITGDPGRGVWVPPTMEAEEAKATILGSSNSSAHTDFSHEAMAVLFGHTRLPCHTAADDCKKNVWLFNITADPHERHDIASDHEHIVKALLDRLQFYQSGAVPCRFPPSDPRADPRLHGDSWEPWM